MDSTLPIQLTAISIGLLMLRLVVGLAMAAHGSQKLFGWFGGHGLAGTGGFFEMLGFKPGRLFALAAGATEVLSGILVAAGFLGPIGPALMLSVMIVAAVTVHWKHGYFAQSNGIELPLLYADVPSKERHKRAKEALERVGLADRTGHHPNQLSGGQQQRVAIARALVGRPKVILADEPTGNLDSQTSVNVMALFQELGKEGITVVLVTHEPDIAEFASRVIVVKDGLVQSDRSQNARQAYRVAALENAS